MEDPVVQQVNALKREGNAHFQRKQYAHAIEFYSHALQLLETSGDTMQLTIPITLNRVWAYLETKDRTLLQKAEQDCTAVLRKQAHCVKAFYRRAMARERMGKLQEALNDVQQLLSLEPSNPAGLQLQYRLLELQEHETLHRDLQDKCAITTKESPAQVIRKNANDVWAALQEEESKLRQTFHKAKPSSTKKTRPATKNQPTANRQQQQSGAILKKTDDAWKSLTMEEVNTMANVYKKKKTTDQHKMATARGAKPSTVVNGMAQSSIHVA